MSCQKFLPSIAALLLAGMVPAGAKMTHPGCADFKPEEFKYVKVVSKQSDTTLREPVRMAFDSREGGKTDIYIGERHGKIKRYDAVKDEVTVLGDLEVFSDTPERLPYAEGSETGINGLALDPKFKENGRIWVFYSPLKDSTFRLSRFTIKDGKLDMASEKIVLDIPEGRKHAGSTFTIPGGPIAFDAKGDLWIAIGANSEQHPSFDEKNRKRSAEASSANMADLRGSILRIRPDETAKGYTVPAGNLGEYWAAEFEKQGRADLAKDYADPVKTRSEIYIKGTRNPYSMTIDPKTGWVTWGEFGPSRAKVEELNVATRPMYAGYPYWAGKNIFVLDNWEPYKSANMDAKAPINASVWNAGPRQLPPAEPSMIAYNSDGNGFQVGNNPISGPIYRYDPALDSRIKLPPHFDGAWFSTDRWMGVRVFQLNGAGDGYLDSAALVTDFRFYRPTDMQQGPDGAIYVIDYAGYHATVPQTHIGRIEYNGSCRPGVTVAAAPARAAAPRVRVSMRSIRVDEPGPHHLRIRSVEGKEIASIRGEGPREYPLGLPSGRGVYIVTLDPGRGSWVVPAF